MLTILILSVSAIVAGVLVWPRLAGAPLWRATTTPLASIIGSGFLVLGPVLEHAYGLWAPGAMALLCALAWVFGAAIRFNIARRDATEQRSAVEDRLEAVASWALALAYFVSVAYYLNLFGAFAVKLTPWDAPVFARIVTTAMLLLILIVGWTRGFSALERLEQVSVGLKLAIIAGLLAGLAWFMAQRASAGVLLANPPQVTGWAALTLGFGLIVTVQGFETSRYLGNTYGAAVRIRSMRLAQLLSAGIYVTYILLIAYAFDRDDAPLNETAIIDMMGQVALILPIMLTIAALAAQFSAAVADTGGSGGLIHELTHGRVAPHRAYALLVGIGLMLTWSFDVFEIITYASRAFAAYYALQSAIAARGALALGRTPLVVGYGALALIGVAVAVLGQPIE